MSEDKPDLSTKTNASESTDKPKVVEEQEVVVRVIKPEHETLLQANGENNEVTLVNRSNNSLLRSTTIRR
jgi:hypothetical protein